MSVVVPSVQDDICERRQTAALGVGDDTPHDERVVEILPLPGQPGIWGVVDVPTLLIALAVLGITWRFKVPESLLIAAGAAAGLIIVLLR